MKKKHIPYSIRSVYYLYFLMHGQEIVYIGFTGRLRERLKHHKWAGKIFTSHKSIKLDYYNYENTKFKENIVLGFKIERKLIKAFKPKYNGDCITGRVTHSQRLKEKRILRLNKAA